MKTGVLIHSRHLRTPDWVKVMWGVLPDSMGQLPKGVLTAIEENAEVIVLGCGLRSGYAGEMESEYNRDYLLKNFPILAEFSAFQDINLAQAREKIAEIIVPDIHSLNTNQEIRFAGKIFEETGIERVITVTSRTGAPYCLNELLKFYGRPESKIAVHNVSVQASDTGWAPNDDVVVLEPPHRPDDIAGELRQKVAKMVLNPVKLMEIKIALGL